MPKVFIGVGSNLGERAGYLGFAQKELVSAEGIRGLQCSPVYETEPIAAEGGPFLNAVWSFEAEWLPGKLLEKFHEIEAKAGRLRHQSNEARTLDLDLLFYGDQVIQEQGLTVPHPRIHERIFVLAPFCDLAPGWVHPVFKTSMLDLKNRLGGIAAVRKVKI